MATTTERHLLSPSMKMADLMNQRFCLLGVLTRMGIPFGFGDETVEEVCRKQGIDPETFLLISAVYAIDGYMPTKEKLEKADLRDVLKYLRLSHAYYMDVALQELEMALENLIAPCGEKHKRIIWKFFADYKDELSKHFEYEEKTVFPHAEAVLRQGVDRNFTIGEYEENHSNVEEKLEDLKNLVMKYLPPVCGQQDTYKALFYIFSLEEDLEKHTVVEDEILVPIVNRLESHE
ncbi:MAG: hemerythrin domain-containing protein [Bacteroidales bacterium]|nr:hemerythrin domain-containing protein [Bacteroidales bacterium]